MHHCLYSLSPGSASFRFRHVGGRAESLLDGLLTLLSLLVQDVPWASMERTAPWCASVRTEPTATTSPGSVPAARASWGSAVSRVSVSAQRPWALLLPESRRSYAAGDVMAGPTARRVFELLVGHFPTQLASPPRDPAALGFLLAVFVLRILLRN